MGHTDTKQLFVGYINSNLTGCHIFSLAKSGNSSFWNKERMWSIPYTKMIVTGTAITFISQRCSEERSEKGFQGLGASGDEDGGAV